MRLPFVLVQRRGLCLAAPQGRASLAAGHLGQSRLLAGFKGFFRRLLQRWLQVGFHSCFALQVDQLGHEGASRYTRRTGVELAGDLFAQRFGQCLNPLVGQGVELLPAVSLFQFLGLALLLDVLGKGSVVRSQECVFRVPRCLVGGLPPLLFKNVSDDAGDLRVLAKFLGIGILDDFAPIGLRRLARLLGLRLTLGGFRFRRLSGLGLLRGLRRGPWRLGLRRLLGRRGCGFSLYVRCSLLFVSTRGIVTYFAFDHK